MSSAASSTLHGASAPAIQHHYDLDVGFWRLWLDRRMAYSCALWDDAQTLDEAQHAKLAWHAANVGARGASRVLDVGCGWGSMLLHLAQEQSVQRVVGLTLSHAQQAYVRDMHCDAIELHLEHWANHRPSLPYDGIISIGAFEHFAKPGLTRAQKVAGYRDFFRKCHAWLVPDGRLSLQTVAYGNMTPDMQNGFLETEVYPESELPALAEIVDASAGLFEIELVRNDRAQYERTCREWLKRLKAERAAATELVGAAHTERYLRYLKYCIVGFHVGNAHLLRLVMRRNALSRVSVA